MGHGWLGWRGDDTVMITIIPMGYLYLFCCNMTLFHFTVLFYLFILLASYEWKTSRSDDALYILSRRIIMSENVSKNRIF